MSNYIYILSNDSFEDYTKIGVTSRDDIQKRISELNRSTPTPFILRKYYLINNDKINKEFYEDHIRKTLFFKHIVDEGACTEFVNLRWKIVVEDIDNEIKKGALKYLKEIKTDASIYSSSKNKEEISKDKRRLSDFPTQRYEPYWYLVNQLFKLNPSNKLFKNKDSLKLTSSTCYTKVQDNIYIRTNDSNIYDFEKKLKNELNKLA